MIFNALKGLKTARHLTYALICLFWAGVAAAANPEPPPPPPVGKDQAPGGDDGAAGPGTGNQKACAYRNAMIDAQRNKVHGSHLWAKLPYPACPPRPARGGFHLDVWGCAPPRHLLLSSSFPQNGSGGRKNDCPNSIYQASYLPFLATEEELGEGQLLYYTDSVSSNYAHPNLLKFNGLPVMSATFSDVGTARIYKIIHSNGASYRFRVFQTGIFPGLPLDDAAGNPARLVMVDALGTPVAFPSAVSVRQYFGGGSYVEFPKNGGMVQKLVTSTGRTYNFPLAEVMIITQDFQNQNLYYYNALPGTGSLRQIKTRSGMFDIVRVGTRLMEIRQYPASQVGSLSGGLYSVIGSPVSITRFDAPAGTNNEVTITTIKGGVTRSIRHTVTYSGAAEQWTQHGTNGDFQYRRVLDRTLWQGQPVAHYQSNWQARLLAAPGMAYNPVGWADYSLDVKSNNFMPRIVQETFPGGISLSREFEYANLAAGVGERSRQMTSTGTILEYDYDPATRRMMSRTLTQVVPPGGGSAPSTYQESFDYTPLAPGEVLDPFDQTPRMVTAYADNVTTGRQLFAFLTAATGYTEIAEKVSNLAVTTLGDPSSMRWESQYYPPCAATGALGLQAGRLKRQIAPDKTVTDYTYTAAGPGELLITTTYQLPANGVPLPGRSLRSKMRFNKYNLPVENTVGIYLTGGWSDAIKMTATYNAHDQLVTLVQKDVYSGRETTLLDQVWDGDLLMQSTDDEGVTTINTYFPGTEVLSSTTRQAIPAFGVYPAQEGITTTYSGTFTIGSQQEPIWKARTATTTATNSSLSLTSTTINDALGRTVSSTDRNGLTTSVTYATDFTSSTTTLPNTGTREEHWTSLGETLRTTGSSQVASFYHREPLVAGGFRTTTYTGADEGPRYTKLETDAAGRKFKEVKPAYDGGLAETIYEYQTGCSCGRPGVILRSGKPAEVFEYDSLVEVLRSGMSADGNTLELDSIDDRISEQTVLFEKDSTVTPATLWQVTRSYLYPTAGDATKKLVSTTRNQVAGFGGDDVARQQKTELGNATTTETTTIDRINHLTQIVSSHAAYSGIPTSVSRAGRPTRSRGAADTADTVTTYDALGRVYTVQRPGLANPQITTYQTGKARVGTVQAPHGLLTTYLYGDPGAAGAGQITEMQTAGSGSVFYVYDLHGRVERKSGDRTYPAQYSYDLTSGEMKTLTTWRDYAGNTGTAVTTWNYEPATGLLLSKVDDSAKATHFTYDIASRLVTRTDALNVVTTFLYDDPQKDLTSLTYSDGTAPVVQNYDRLGRPWTTTTGTVAKLVRTYSSAHLGDETQSITYDTNGNGTLDAADLARVLTRQYNDPVMTGRNSGYTLTPAGAGAEASAIYGFESVAGRLETVTAGSALGSTASSYIYEPARPHLIKTLTTPSHVVTNAWEPNRDVLDFKQNLQGTVNRSTYDYTVNPVGQRTAVATSGYAGGSWIWDYDTLGQVKKADNTTSTAYDRVYEYDTIGNRKKTADGTLTLPAADNWTANSLNQINTVNSFIPSYDDAGNLISDAGANGTGISRDYHWDAENRLVRVTPSIPGSDVATYRYDAWHRRISKTKAGLTTWFIYNGWNLIAEYTGTTGNVPALKKVHHWGLDLSGSIQGAGGVGGLLATDLLDTTVAGLSGRYYPTYDGNGNVSEYLKTGGVAVARFTYDPFGRPFIATTSALAQQLSFRFSTKYRDEETDFYYYGYRYYSTLMGRWINRDPIGEMGGANLYSFVENDGLNYLDALGLYPVQEANGMFSHMYNGKLPTVESPEKWIDAKIKEKGKFVNVYENGEKTINSEDCATGAQYLAGTVSGRDKYDVPKTAEWRKGAKVDGNQNIKPGTVVAAGWNRDGTYNNKDIGQADNHTAIYLGQDKYNTYVLDQWDGKPIGVTAWPKTEEKFSVVLTRSPKDPNKTTCKCEKP